MELSLRTFWTLLRELSSRRRTCGAQKLIGDLQDSEIARFFVVLPGPQNALAFLIERFIA